MMRLQRTRFCNDISNIEPDWDGERHDKLMQRIANHMAYPTSPTFVSESLRRGEPVLTKYSRYQLVK